MTLFPHAFEADALAYAAAGGQALHVLGVSPGRLYDLDLPRLVATARRLGLQAVRVPRTGTPLQHVEIRGMPLIRACMNARTVDEAPVKGASFGPGCLTPVHLVDMLSAALPRAQIQEAYR